jgi:hypothetical protein
MVPMDRAWQDWIMSTQRREGRSTLATKIGRMVVRLGSRLFYRVAPESRLRATSPVRHQGALQQTPKTERPFRQSRNRRPQTLCHRIAATNRPFTVFPGSPPLAYRSVDAPSSHCSIRSHLIHFPAVGSRFHPALPRVPAALCRRTERHDGKGNLYFQHAA